MGACCSSGRTPPDGTPVYFYCPPVLEERMPLPFVHSTISTVSSSVLVDANLDTSSPDIYRAPPPPLPYDALIDALHGHSIDTATGVAEKHSNEKTKIDCSQDCLESTEKELSKIEEPAASIEEDSCPICLEEYDKENPRILTKCEHHFHLSCILEWMERSDSCPICDQVVLSLASEFSSIEEDGSRPQPVEL